MSTKSKSEKPGKSKGLLGIGIVTAIAASLCCITPALALISGIAGAASTFSWMEPIRPYLLGITILILAFAWYQKLKPRTVEEIECACEPARSVGGEDEKKTFMQTKTFLAIVTMFAALMMAFPYYGDIFYPKADKQVIVISSDKLQEVKFNVSGMSCSGCEEHVIHAVNELPGILNVTANYEEGSAIVKFHDSKTSKDEIVKTIDATGYKVKK